MKHYIFLTVNIHRIGGMQTYVASKAKFLEAEGWKVNVFFSGRSNDGECAVKSLNKYKDGWFPEISIPPGNWPSFIREHVLRDMRRQVGDLDGTVIVESQASGNALWGELLASQIGAKHFCFICNELFRGKDRFYEEYLEFFDFKHRRKEIAGIHASSMTQLFEGYKCIMPEENYVFVAADEGPVQDVENVTISKMEQADWTVCYIGRIEKGYVPKILKGVYNFSQMYPQKRIQFIFVGDAKKRVDLIEKTFSDAGNVKLIFLGDCVPIPRVLFSKTDVVIAGSGSALCAARENVLTIVADAENFMACGILGIDTFNALYHEENAVQMSYEDALKKILVRREYENRPIQVSAAVPPEFYYQEHFKLIERSNENIIYYNVVRKRKYSLKFKWMLYRCDWMIKILIRRIFL